MVGEPGMLGMLGLLGMPGLLAGRERQQQRGEGRRGYIMYGLCCIVSYNCGRESGAAFRDETRRRRIESPVRLQRRSCPAPAPAHAMHMQQLLLMRMRGRARDIQVMLSCPRHMACHAARRPGTYTPSSSAPRDQVPQRPDFRPITAPRSRPSRLSAPCVQRPRPH
jgi:hypothetical protein